MRRWRTLVVCVLAAIAPAACGAPPATEREPAAATTEKPSQPAYNGLPIPGLEDRPVWSSPGGGIRTAVGLSSSFAFTSGKSLTVMDGATGKKLSSVPLALSDERLYADRPLVLARDGDQRQQPVAVVRYMRVTPASGFQGQQTKYADLVVDNTGRTVWQSPPPDGQSGHTDFYQSDYRVRATFDNYAGSGPKPVLMRPTTITDASGTQVANLEDGNDYSYKRKLYGVYDGKAIAARTEQNSRIDDLMALDLRANGKTAWRLTDVEFIGVFGSTLVAKKNRRERTLVVDYTLDFYDVRTGKLLQSAAYPPRFNCSRPVYDLKTGVVICVGVSVIAIDVAAGKVLWQQPASRGFRPVAAMSGVVYAEVNGSSGSDTFMAVAAQTGKVLADNLPTVPQAVTDDGVALVEHFGEFYGFRVAPSTAPLPSTTT
ncbi:PQQ-binding-like beta-propeller repeat protein [Nonomuraea sp. NPDC046802]|uniref:outer membrane protein assembly factor BamB family protein n=1 Tax=Nonomuraea sp. NPDC046802 TaxID=3154919 RepID=UPI0033C61464